MEKSRTDTQNSRQNEKENTAGETENVNYIPNNNLKKYALDVMEKTAKIS